MRKFEMDNKAVFAPNASHLGFDKWKVKRGDVFSYSVDGVQHIGRSLGRIKWCDNDGDDCRGWICALVLGNAAEHCYIRWIDPAWINQIVAVPTKLAAFFFAAKLPYDNDMLLNLAAYGTLSEQYIDRAGEHVNAWKILTLFTANGRVAGRCWPQFECRKNARLSNLTGGPANLK